ncbi:MAG: hypothetical protein OQK09_01530 [Colwellia sp.]|nr:hypothetical protein [Colwellia sp.]MCW9080168.1 hypothetical protein [Colwellia sp.]
MHGYPPVALVETWLFLATNQSPELEHVKLPLRRVIKDYFGSNELAKLYVEQFKVEQAEVHYL